jgi:taurine dioxygenase
MKSAIEAYSLYNLDQERKMPMNSSVVASPPGVPEVVPMDAPIGAEIRGVDLARSIGDAQMQAIMDALHQHAVIVFRGQQIEPGHQKAFASRLGEMRTSFYNRYGVPGHSELTVVSNLKNESGEAIGIADAGMLWHTDASYLKTPDMYTVLYGIEIPHRDGRPIGDTLFTSAGLAYDELPDDIRRRVDNLRAVHSFSAHLAKKQARKQLRRAPLTDEQKKAVPDVDHPVVRRHPITGRKCLFVTDGHTSHILGLPEQEAEELLHFLTGHIQQERFHYRHSWRKGDLIVWDNAAVQHLAVFDYGDIPRRLHRAGIAGPVPV